MHYGSPVNIYLFKVNNRNTRKRCEICPNLAIKTPEQRQWRRSGVFIVNFEHIFHLFLVFLLLLCRFLLICNFENCPKRSIFLWLIFVAIAFLKLPWKIFCQLVVERCRRWNMGHTIESIKEISIGLVKTSIVVSIFICLMKKIVGYRFGKVTVNTSSASNKDLVYFRIYVVNSIDVESVSA